MTSEEVVRRWRISWSPYINDEVCEALDYVLDRLTKLENMRAAIDDVFVCPYWAAHGNASDPECRYCEVEGLLASASRLRSVAG